MDNLAKDAMLAKQNGISYGKFIAMRYEKEHTYVKKQEQDVDEEKERSGYIRCVFCNKYFYPNSGAQKYCSEMCRNRQKISKKGIAL